MVGSVRKDVVMSWSVGGGGWLIELSIFVYKYKQIVKYPNLWHFLLFHLPFFHIYYF